MPRFFFDFHDGIFARDTEGMELENLDAAIIQAKRLLPEVALDELPKAGEEMSYWVSVRDEHDAVVYTAHLDFHGTLTET